MRSFMFVTFAFLAFAFYHLSGGNAYEPVAHSVQARAAAKAAGSPIVATTLPAPRSGAIAAGDLATVRITKSQAPQPSRDPDQAGTYEVTLASAAPLTRSADPTAGVPEPARATAIMEAIEAAVEEAVQEALPDEGAATPVFSLETYVASSGDVSSEPLFARPSVTRELRPDIRTVSGSSVNMRSGPGTEFRVLGSLPQGTEVAILDEPGNGWIMFEVTQSGETGWMADWLVTASNE